jgi:hypothetical protein
MIVNKCNSPLGEIEIHCNEREFTLIKDFRKEFKLDMNSPVNTKTGINCSCVCDTKKWVFFFCLKHTKEIFGLDLADYEKFRTDIDR